MSTLTRIARYAFIAAVTITMTACVNQKEPAQKVLIDIAAAVTAAGADAEKYVPDQVAAIKAKVADLQAAARLIDSTYKKNENH